MEFGELLKSEISIITGEDGNAHTTISGTTPAILACYSCLTMNLFNTLTKNKPELKAMMSQAILQAYSLGMNAAMEEMGEGGEE